MAAGFRLYRDEFDVDIGGLGSGCLSPPNCATVAAHSGPGSVRTMRSLAASSFFVEGGATYGRDCDQPGPPWCDHRSAAALAATRCCPSCALPLLPDGKIRVLAVGQPAALGRLPRLPAAGTRRPGSRGGGRQHDDALGLKPAGAERYESARADLGRRVIAAAGCCFLGMAVQVNVVDTGLEGARGIGWQPGEPDEDILGARRRREAACGRYRPHPPRSPPRAGRPARGHFRPAAGRRHRRIPPSMICAEVIVTRRPMSSNRPVPGFRFPKAAVVYQSLRQAVA